MIQRDILFWVSLYFFAKNRKKRLTNHSMSGNIESTKGVKDMTQAKKIFTMYGKYSNVVTHEYRGMKYDVEYAKDWTYCCTSPKIQHQNAQDRIDKELDTPKTEGHPVDLDEIWNMMGWD